MARAIESRVKQLRLRNGWSQERLGGLAGVPSSAVRRSERGLILTMRVEALLRIANALDVSVADCWPLLGPLPMPEAKARNAGIQARILAIEAKRAERVGALDGESDWQSRDSA